jgi:hypothetical protein
MVFYTALMAVHVHGMMGIGLGRYMVDGIDTMDRKTRMVIGGYIMRVLND